MRNFMKLGAGIIAASLFMSAAHAGNLTTEGLDDPQVATPCELRGIPYENYAMTGRMYARDNGTYHEAVWEGTGTRFTRYDSDCSVISSTWTDHYNNDPQRAPELAPTPTPVDPVDDGPKQGCNGSKCAPDSGGGNSEGDEQSDNDDD